MDWLLTQLNSNWRASGLTVPGWVQNAISDIATDIGVAALIEAG